MNLRELLFLHAASGGGGSIVEKTATGNPVSFTTQIAKPVKSIIVPLSYAQEGSGDPSPSNVRPITGVSSFIVTHNNSAIDVVFPALGKNLLKVTANSKTEAGVTYTVNTDGTITLSGTASGYTGLTVGSVDIQSVQKITISGLSGNTTNVVWDSFNLYDADDTLVQSISGGGSAGNKTIDLSQYPTAVRMTVAIKRSNNVATSGTAKPMVEIGETVSTFEPYNNSVYGGSLDLVSGVLTLTHQILVATWGEGTNSRVYTNNERRRFEFSSACVAAGNTATGACNIAKWIWDYGLDTIHFYNHQTYSYVFLPIETSDSTEIQIVGTLATPITIQLDPHSITAIKGTNTVWTDTTGDLTIKYLDKA